MMKVITGSLSMDEKQNYMKYINKLYKGKTIEAVHMTPIEDKVSIEVTFTASKTHVIKAHSDDSFEEYELPLNDR